MGLNITALRRITLVRALAPGEQPTDEEGNDYKRLHFVRGMSQDFPHHADGLVRGIYTAEEVFDFHGGSYGGYNAWRRALSNVFLGCDPETVWANFARFTDMPFAWLIHFSDAEGVIGPKLSARLFREFDEHKDFAGLHRELDDYGQYTHFGRAFLLAQDGGAVLFH